MSQQVLGNLLFKQHFFKNNLIVYLNIKYRHRRRRGASGFRSIVTAVRFFFRQRARRAIQHHYRDFTIHLNCKTALNFSMEETGIYGRDFISGAIKNCAASASSKQRDPPSIGRWRTVAAGEIIMVISW